MRNLQLLLILLCIGIMPAYAQQAVTSFTLINADTDVAIKTLVNGDVINYSALGTHNLNIRANTSPATVGSVVFSLDGGNKKVENTAPYAYAGDFGGSGPNYDYKPINPPLTVGSHTLSATPYSSSNGIGTAGGTHTVSFSVVENSGGNLSITSFTLVNADNEQDIRTLVNGDVVNYSTLPTRNLNIRANTNPATVGSVVFFLDGTRKNENVKPYTYAGEVVSGSDVNYNAINPPMAAGSHTLNATAYSSANGGGTSGTTHAISFSVVDNNTSNPPPTANAGPDKTLTLPTNSTTLSGSGSDPGGSIASYLWTKQSGPSATLSNTTTPTLSVSNMVAGTYVFRLLVTDNQGATGYDEATVFVNTSGGGGTCATFIAQNGLAVVEIESQPTTGDWTKRTTVSGYTGTGYYEWRYGNTNTAAIPAGTGILTYGIQISTPGRYRLQVRSAAPAGTDFNDVWIKFPQGNCVALRSGSTINLGSSWFKMYQNVSGNNWTWDTKHKDHDPHSIYVDFNSAGTYQMQFSGRSTQFKIDRFVLYHSSVATATATNTSNPQSPCAGPNKTSALIEDESATWVNAYPNPSSGNVTLELNVAQAGKVVLQIFDIKGALIESLFEGSMEAGETKRVAFDGSKLSKGIYIARLIAPDKVVTKQIAIQ